MNPNDENNQELNDPINQPEPFNPEKPKTKMSPLKLALIAAALLVVGVFAVLSRSDSGTSDNANNNAIPENVESGQISITDKGFNPATITIKVGQAVTWTNDGKKQHQIASDPHPTDDALADLNDDAPLLTGDSFSYVFEEAGTYTYHDELNPLGLNGTVIVE